MKIIVYISTGTIFLTYLFPRVFGEDLLMDSLMQYSAHVSNKVNSQFEMMFDNWISNYIGLFNKVEEPKLCSTCSESGVVNSSATATSNSSNSVPNSTVNGNVSHGIVTEEETEIVSLNETVLCELYNKMRIFIEDPLPIPDRNKSRSVAAFFNVLGSTKNVKVAGFSKYHVIDVKLNMSCRTMSNTFAWPLISMYGMYELYITGPRINYNGKGSFSFNVSNILMSFDLTLGENDNATLKLDVFDLNLEIGNVSLRLDNLQDGENIMDTTDSFLGGVFQQAVSMTMPQITNMLRDSIADRTNRYLSQMYFKNLTNLISLFI